MSIFDLFRRRPEGELSDVEVWNITTGHNCTSCEPVPGITWVRFEWRGSPLDAYRALLVEVKKVKEAH